MSTRPPRRSTPADRRRFPVERYRQFFKICERGCSVSREIRGGLATFFAMAYIVVLNPIILGAGTDMYGHQLDNGQLVAATALMAGFTTLLMGVIGNVPIALAAGLGVNAVVALQLAPRCAGRTRWAWWCWRVSWSCCWSPRGCGSG
ncbi:hypothetical protein SANTM175S_01496 [Streptomyces antimycoticus]